MPQSLGRVCGIRDVLRMVEKTRSKRIGDMARPFRDGFMRSTSEWSQSLVSRYMAVCQNLVPLVNIKIAGKWMFIPLKMVLIGIDPYPYSRHLKSQIFWWLAGFSGLCYHALWFIDVTRGVSVLSWLLKFIGVGCASMSWHNEQVNMISIVLSLSCLLVWEWSSSSI